MKKESLIAVRKSFTNPLVWRAAKELIRRGYKIQDRKRHWNWEWISIEDK